MTLIAHKDTHYVNEAAVKAVPAPEWTDSWHPVAHKEVLEAVDYAAREAGLETTERLYSLNKAGTRMFGFWQLADSNSGTADGTDGVAGALAIRNSTDKSMVLGVAAGSTVLVCDNLALSGDYLRFRKHTGGLDLDELREIAADAIDQALVRVEGFKQWLLQLKETEMPEAHWKIYAYNLAMEGAIPSSKLPQLAKAWSEEQAETGGNLYAAHGAVTRLNRGAPLFRQERSNRVLNRITNEYRNALNF